MCMDTSEKTPGGGLGQGSLLRCSPWGHKASDLTERRINSDGSNGISAGHRGSPAVWVASGRCLARLTHCPCCNSMWVKLLCKQTPWLGKGAKEWADSGGVKDSINCAFFLFLVSAAKSIEKLIKKSYTRFLGLQLVGLLITTNPWTEAIRASQVALVVNNPLASAEDLRDEDLIRGLGRSPGGGHDNTF